MAHELCALVTLAEILSKTAKPTNPAIDPETGETGYAALSCEKLVLPRPALH